MGKPGVINVWIREPDDCSVYEGDGTAWASPCCNKKKIYQGKIEKGHAQIEVPPGCYIVDARVWPGCCGSAKETMAIVKCEETVCVNLIREYAGGAIKALPAIIAHARGAKIKGAKIPQKDIQTVVDVLEIVANAVPAGKVGTLSAEEYAIIEEVSDDEHKEILNSVRSIVVKEKSCDTC